MREILFQINDIISLTLSIRIKKFKKLSIYSFVIDDYYV